MRRVWSVALVVAVGAVGCSGDPEGGGSPPGSTTGAGAGGPVATEVGTTVVDGAGPSTTVYLPPPLPVPPPEAGAAGGGPGSPGVARAERSAAQQEYERQTERMRALSAEAEARQREQNRTRTTLSQLETVESIFRDPSRQVTLVPNTTVPANTTTTGAP